MEELLQVKDLSISFHTYNGEVQAVRNASFDLHRKEVLAIVGESGSGKSVTMQTDAEVDTLRAEKRPDYL